MSSSPSCSASGSPPSPIVDGFALSGVSDLPDPSTHAWRKDLADAALAGRVIASHFAVPLDRRLAAAADLFDAPGGALLATLKAGDCFRLVDDSRGWAWGYAPDGRVGYVTSEALGA